MSIIAVCLLTLIHEMQLSSWISCVWRHGEDGIEKISKTAIIVENGTPQTSVFILLLAKTYDSYCCLIIYRLMHPFRNSGKINSTLLQLHCFVFTNKHEKPSQNEKNHDFYWAGLSTPCKRLEMHFCSFSANKPGSIYPENITD